MKVIKSNLLMIEVNQNIFIAFKKAYTLKGINPYL